MSDAAVDVLVTQAEVQHKRFRRQVHLFRIAWIAMSALAGANILDGSWGWAAIYIACALYWSWRQNGAENARDKAESNLVRLRVLRAGGQS